MKRTKADKLIAKHFESLMPKEVSRLNTLAYYDLHFGPLQGCDVCGVDTVQECTCEPKWCGFESATEVIANWAKETLPHELYVDMDCESISTEAPEGYTDEETGEYVEPYTDEIYLFDYKDIKRAVFGELADYL